MADQRLTIDPVPVFAALGDRTRLLIVTRLADCQSYPISSLASEFAMSRQAVTKHLKVLQQAGLVTYQRVGRESLYQLTLDGLEATRAFLDRVLTHYEMASAQLQERSRKD